MTARSTARGRPPAIDTCAPRRGVISLVLGSWFLVRPSSLVRSSSLVLVLVRGPRPSSLILASRSEPLFDDASIRSETYGCREQVGLPHGLIAADRRAGKPHVLPPDGGDAIPVDGPASSRKSGKAEKHATDMRGRRPF